MIHYHLASLRIAPKSLTNATVALVGEDVRVARERIRLYLIEHVGEVINGGKLEVISGITDYRQRIRELRLEQGYQIIPGAFCPPGGDLDLRKDQYFLVQSEPDKNAPRRWHVAIRIRRSEQGSRARVLKYLLECVGEIVTTEELAYVAKGAKEFARRVRELRTEEGYPIATRFTGRPDLRSGQYILQSRERVAEPHDRKIPERTQKLVYERDENACQICGWNQSKWRPRDPRILELHHLLEHQFGGQNDESNLAVLCSKCHDKVHAGKHKSQIQRLKESLDSQ